METSVEELEDLELVLQRFSVVLKNCREMMGRTQAAVATQAGLHSTFISDLERAQTQPGLQTLLKLGRGLSMSAAVLVARTEEALQPSTPKSQTAGHDAEERIPLGTDVCPKCKTGYVVFAQRLPKRERGRFKCRRCKTQIASWLATTRLVYVTEPPAPKARGSRRVQK